VKPAVAVLSVSADLRRRRMRTRSVGGSFAPAAN